MKPLVYIAGPYKSDPVLGTRNAIKAGMAVYDTGLAAVIVPHTTMLADFVTPRSVQHWYAFDLDQLAHCHAVLRLEGDSAGADAEVEFAEDRGLPVFFMLDQLIAWLRSLPATEAAR